MSEIVLMIPSFVSGIHNQFNKALRPLRICLGLLLLPTLTICALFFVRHAPNATANDSYRPSEREFATSKQSAFEQREAAYRANNVGVALLEQYKTKEAAEEFRRALEIDPELRLARINLSIALYYVPDEDGARREAELVLTSDPNGPHAHYILGLIARAQNRFDDAIAEIQRVLKIDTADVGSNINIGQIFVQQRKYQEAIAAFRAALAAEPYNETALYNLGMLLSRTGAKDEGRRLISRFEQFRRSGAGTTLGAGYLEGGHYAEAVVSTGAEVGMVDRSTPEVAFNDVTASILAPRNGVGKTAPSGRRQTEPAKLNAGKEADAIVLFDYDGDGDLDIFDASGSQRLLRNDGKQFADVTAESGLSIGNSRHCFAAVAGDYDNDGKPDLFVVRANPNSFVLYHNDGNGHFSDRTKESGITVPSLEAGPYVAVAFVDVDHDGDLDILVSGPTNILFRNNGNGAFTENAQAAGLSVHQLSPNSSAIVPTDFNNNRDVDLFLLSPGSSPKLFSNMRDGTFRDVAKEAGLNSPETFSCVAAGDINKDGFTDFFLGGGGTGVFAMSDGRRHFKLIAAPAETRNALAAQFVDYDNDGLLDLLVVTAQGLRMFRNLGSDFQDVSKRAFPRALQNVTYDYQSTTPRHAGLVSGDIDGDGDVDLIVRGPHGELQILRNDGGNRNRSIKIDLHGRVSNKSAVEAKIEMRAGSLWQKLETYSASPAPAPADLIFGLGKRDKPDAVRVLWPAGIVQAETEFPAVAQAGPQNAGFTSMIITELDRKPSSCPYLYAWNGEHFEFITDFMGAGEMGYLEQPGQYNKPNPREYVRIRDDQLKEKDGRYELRVTNELEEALFVDRLQLLVVTHPSDAEVYPNEGMSDPPKPFRLFVTRRARPPLTAIDEHGHDVLDPISRLDRRWPDDFGIDRIRGYAEAHYLTLKLGDDGTRPNSKGKPRDRNLNSEGRSRWPLQNQRMIMLLTGWTDYAWSSDNVAATQAGKTMKPPALQVKDKNGNWRTVIKDIGIPVGRPQTVTVDLTGKFLSADREVRIVTNMRIYWDQILVDTSDSNAPEQITRLDPVRADLHWRGFSAEVTPDGREPFGYDYQRVSFTSPWKVMSGRYTREGDVRELLLNTDDMFAICRPGDEISLSFDASSLPPLAGGWKRTFLLDSDGFSKEMDINSASPDQLAPLPFHGMSHYPYKWPEQYPLDQKHREYIEQYNTRLVMVQVPRVEAGISAGAECCRGVVPP